MIQGGRSECQQEFSVLSADKGSLALLWASVHSVDGLACRIYLVLANVSLFIIVAEYSTFQSNEPFGVSVAPSLCTSACLLMVLAPPLPGLPSSPLTPVSFCHRTLRSFKNDNCVTVSFAYLLTEPSLWTPF